MLTLCYDKDGNRTYFDGITYADFEEIENKLFDELIEEGFAYDENFDWWIHEDGRLAEILLLEDELDSLEDYVEGMML